MRFALFMVVTGFLLAGCVRDEPAPTTSATTQPTTNQPAPATPTGSSPAEGKVKLTSVVKDLSAPVLVTHAGDGSGRLFILEQTGKIKILKNGVLQPTPFLDLSSLVVYGGERGLLGLAFHPDYKTNGAFFVDYTRSSTVAGEAGDTVVARYKVSPLDPDIADPASAEIILTQDQPQANHNGGMLAFGPDGYLYIGFGDGGGAADVGAGHNVPNGNGQALDTWLGKLLRIEVGASGPYKVPPSNPNLGSGSKPEIWSYGLRNPWRFSFDAATGDLYIGDVGQNAWEEIDFQPASSKGGENYGWNVYEGTHLYRAGVVLVHTGPVAEYDHNNGDCSITGGYVYRGSAVAALAGFYVVGDYCTGRAWTLARVAGTWSLSPFMDTDHHISSFGEDENHELYLVDLDGEVLRFDPK